MTLVSIGALIFFVNDVAHSMQVETILGRVTHDVLERIEALFPEELGEPASDEGENFWRQPEGEPYMVRSSKAGYLQHVDERRVLDVVTDQDLFLKMEQPVGHFVVEGDTLALVWPAKGGEECGAELADAFLLGNERALYQDVRRGIIELTDIAVRCALPERQRPHDGASVHRSDHTDPHGAGRPPRSDSGSSG